MKINSISATPIDWLVKEVNSDCTNSTFINPELIRSAKQKELRKIKTLQNLRRKRVLIQCVNISIQHRPIIRVHENDCN